MKKAWVLLILAVVLITSAYANMKINQSNKEKKLYQDIYNNLENTKIECDFQLADDSVQSFNYLELNDQQIATVEELDETLDQYTFYNDQILYCYKDDVYHLMYGNQEILQSKESMYFTGKNNIYIFVYDENDEQYNTIYSFDGELKQLWQNEFNQEDSTFYRSRYFDNKEDRLVFIQNQKIYYEKDGNIESFEPYGNLTFINHELVVVGDYIIYKSKNAKSQSGNISYDITEQIHAFNMNTCKDTALDLVSYNDYGGSIIDCDQFEICTLYFYDIGNNQFVYSDAFNMYVGVIDEENEMFFYDNNAIYSFSGNGIGYRGVYYYTDSVDVIIEQNEQKYIFKINIDSANS